MLVCESRYTLEFEGRGVTRGRQEKVRRAREAVDLRRAEREMLCPPTTTSSYGLLAFVHGRCSGAAQTVIAVPPAKADTVPPTLLRIMHRSE